ncbi:complement decay-accelerating factor isoform X2 [Muntiacus reevesi]|uniref:complement decay-accelerating factor isoform X2 n=1 Tax=Muntiacus reevesi TaxID=9886 RepID=UPI00330757CD
MSPARPRARALLSLLGGLGPQLLLLLLRPPAASGDCGLPPDVPNAEATLRSLTSFIEGQKVTYKCNKGFVKVPGKADSVVCQNNKWSELAEFCNRSCDFPTSLRFASLKKSYIQQNYFPEGSTVEYECRPGYIRDPSLSGNITCLQNFMWSKPDGFCKKRSCPKPREIENGHVNITTDILLGAEIYFSCNTGYKLVGAASSYCSAMGDTVGWTDEFPECQEILCPEPPKVDHGMIQEKQNSYAYGQSVTYKCMEGFTLHGESSIYCTEEDDQGAWSGPLPQCKETFYNVVPTVLKSIEVNVPAKSTAVPRTSPRFHTTSTPKGRGSTPSVGSIIASGCVPVTVIICIIILVKVSRDSGKSGSYYTREDKTHRCPDNW